MTEPLPCPFCGHVGLSQREGSSFRWLSTECNGCGAQCGEERIDTLSTDHSAAIEQAKEAAIKTWNTRAAQPKQQVEPVAWNKSIRDSVDSLLEQAGYQPDSSARHQLAMMNFDATPPKQQAEPTCPECKAAVLYECAACSSNNYPPKQQAEPPQRQWVGLTEEEIARTLGIKTHLLAVIRDARAIEAKLKEKNNG